MVIYGELLYRGELNLYILTLRAKVSRQVACYADVRCCIYAVGCKANADKVVVLDVKVVACGCAHNSLLGKLHNAVVRSADTKLILCAEHTE